MTVGYLHIGLPGRGVRRYGELLAQAAAQRADVNVVEAEVTLTSSRGNNRKRLSDAARVLNRADVVHLQYSKVIWGGQGRDLYYLREFARRCSVPLVVTIHDVYPERRARHAVQEISTTPGDDTRRRSARTLPDYAMLVTRKLRSVVRRAILPWSDDPMVYQWLATHAQQLMVCTSEEAQRLVPFIAPATAEVLPHFVEHRRLPDDRLAIRKMLDLEGRIVVTLLGWIHPRKGHALLVEAMQHLPDEFSVVFAGHPGRSGEKFVQALVTRASELGRADQLRVTGYLPEAELAKYLRAADLAVCPFTGLSASGSLSTWISAGTPILASDLPQIAEYNRLEPGAIRTFSPYEAQVLAEAIKRTVRESGPAQNPALARLQQRLRIDAVIALHLEEYEKAARQSRACADPE